MASNSIRLATLMQHNLQRRLSFSSIYHKRQFMIDGIAGQK